MPATLRRCLGLLFLCLALGASRTAATLLRPPYRRQQRFPGQQQSWLSRLQIRLLAWQAHLQPQNIDTLTGIGTHETALREMEWLSERARAFTMIRLSINNVKQINKTLGDATGDQLLVALARRLAHLEYHRGRLYRLGGNEFLMLVTPTEDGEDFVTRLRRHLCQPLELEGTALIPSITLAFLQSPEHGREAHRLLHRSAIALGLARQAHEGYHIYESGHDRRHEREERLLQDLVHGVRDQQLRVAYQPKIRIADGRVEGFEALIQWQHPDLGLIQPDEFLPLAACSGHMALLGNWVIEHVIRQMADWQAQGRPQLIAVNLSVADLEDAQLSRRILDWLGKYGVASRQLMLEVTEQTMMRDPALAAYMLGELRDQGIQVAIDDFGTGYSSLAQLRRLPLDILKIDKSFVLDLPHQPEDAMIVRASVMLAHSFGLEVIAEGVETLEHLAMLNEIGCDQAQGFLVSRPLDADNVLSWLDEYASQPGLARKEPEITTAGKHT